ncbi:MAG: murein transglycosylase A [Novosphingobium sp.]
MRGFAALALVALLGACGRLIPESRVPPSLPTPVATTSALLVGVKPGPAFTTLGVTQLDAAGALASFRESCPRLIARADTSGLTRPDDWRQACTAAASWPAGSAAKFFETMFETVRVGEGKAFATGYYEPEIAGVRVRQAGFDVPVYRLPPDLVRSWPEETPPEQRSGNPPLGRYDENGKFVSYHDRAAIEQGALLGKGLELAWAADPIELFFLQVQGSGRLRAPDGSVVRIGYAGQNGHPYTGIGSLMRQRGLVGAGTAYATSMQGLMQYLRDHPDEGRAIMRENASWVFFKELTGDGPLGALGVPVRRESSVATDPAYVPLGAPVWLALDRPEANGLWIAQDTGGAIKGVNRFDTFWGAGEDARTIAGGMTGRGEALLLLPKSTLARLGAQ